MRRNKPGHGLRLDPKVGLAAAIARPWRTIAILLCFLCACLAPLCGGRAFGATPNREIHGPWVIDLDATTPESVRVYFGGDDAQGQRTKAASLVVRFDTRTMQFVRTVLGKEETRKIANITQIENHQGRRWVVWLHQVKFPDYLEPMADGRLRYGSDWGAPWQFILRRPDTRPN